MFNPHCVGKEIRTWTCLPNRTPFTAASLATILNSTESPSLIPLSLGGLSPPPFFTGYAALPHCPVCLFYTQHIAHEKKWCFLYKLVIHPGVIAIAKSVLRKKSDERGALQGAR
jgi:hypothetical protein